MKCLVNKQNFVSNKITMYNLYDSEKKSKSSDTSVHSEVLSLILLRITLSIPGKDRTISEQIKKYAPSWP